MVRVSKFFSFWCSFLFLLGAFILYGCNNWSSSTGPSETAQIALAFRNPEIWVARAVTVESLTRVTITVSSSDIQTIEKVLISQPWEITIAVAAGNDRVIAVTADATDGNTYTGTDTVNLFAGVTTTVTIRLFHNHAPVISSITLQSNPLPASGTVTMTCNATDEDNDSLTYTWSLNPVTGRGSIVSQTGNQSTYQGGGPSASGTLTVTCVVSDNKGGTDTESVATSASGAVTM